MIRLGRPGRISAVAVLCGAIALSACEKAAVKTSVSPCFRVLPQAHAAVGSQGTFVDVARRKGSTIYPSSGGEATVTTSVPSSRPTVTGPAEGAPAVPLPGTLAPADPRHDGCIVAYRGKFDPSRIPLLRGPNREGRYAIVIVGVRSQQVRSVVLTDRLPTYLHRH